MHPPPPPQPPLIQLWIRYIDRGHNFDRIVRDNFFLAFRTHPGKCSLHLCDSQRFFPLLKPLCMISFRKMFFRTYAHWASLIMVRFPYKRWNYKEIIFDCLVGSTRIAAKFHGCSKNKRKCFLNRKLFKLSWWQYKCRLL